VNLCPFLHRIRFFKKLLFTKNMACYQGYIAKNNFSSKKLISFIFEEMLLFW
jgi:hypothetical protein